jgi:serine/threonine protein kinase
MDELSVSPGDVIADAYRIDALVGEGSMGSVFSATMLDQEGLEEGGKVAIKVLQSRHVRQSEFLDRFIREARVAARLTSPHAVRVFDVGRLDGGVPFFVMEFLQGVDLARHLERVEVLSIQRAADYILQACSAVSEAHELGIVHRDLKLANLFLAREAGGEDRIKVIDFGVSKLLRPLDGGGDVTATTVVMGTPAFMAPEQMRSSKVDARVDVWALGVTLYWLIAGQRPFEGDNIVKIYESILRGPPPLRELRPDVPEGIEAIIQRALVWDPDERLASVAELSRALAPFASGEWSAQAMGAQTVAAEAVEPAQRTEVIDPADIDLPEPAAKSSPPALAARVPQVQRAGRIGILLAVVALALGSYALGARQGGVATPATAFSYNMLQSAQSALDDVDATPAASESAQPPLSATASATASAPIAQPVPRPGGRRPSAAKRGKLTPSGKSSKTDEVWGMP